MALAGSRIVALVDYWITSLDDLFCERGNVGDYWRRGGGVRRGGSQGSEEKRGKGLGSKAQVTVARKRPCDEDGESEVEVILDID